MVNTLQVNNARARFGGVVALDGVDFEAEEGKIHAIIGPNGAGKSTLVGVIAGLAGSAKQITLGGVPIERLSPVARARRGLAVSYQAPSLFGSLTIGENLELVEPLRRRHGGAHDDWLSSLPARYGLEEWHWSRADDAPYPIRKFGDVVRAFLSGPRVLVLDEPAAGLSHDQREQLVELVLEAKSRLRCSIVLIEHDVPLVFALADRVTVLDNGRLIASGPPEEVRQHPEVLRAYLGVSA
ncbi:ABC transporter ATP-binding protein [soil metagenome]